MWGYILGNLDGDEGKAGHQFYIIRDDRDNRFLMYTEVQVEIGDRLLTPDNRIYEITEVKGNEAKARFVGMRTCLPRIRPIPPILLSQ